MRRNCVLFILLIFSFQIVVSLSGGGTLENPFVITTCEELLEIKKAPDKDYILLNDINCYTFSRNNPYSFPLDEFSGSLRGGGGKRRIYGLYINSSNSNIGLFSRTNGALIENISLVDLNLRGWSYVGGFVGYAQLTTIKNCSVTGTITAVFTNVGGIVGLAKESEIFDVNNYASIESTNNQSTRSYSDNAGGVVGSLDNSILENAINFGSIKALNSVGGIVGKMESSILTSCYNFGDINEGRSYIGGIVGFSISNNFTWSKISQCYNNANLYPQSTIVNDNPYQSHYPQYVGGLIGGTGGTILEDSSNKGNLFGGAEVAGLVGRMTGGTITNCVNEGNVTALASGDQAKNKGVSGITNSSLWPNIDICDTVNKGNVVATGDVKSCSFLNTCQYLKYCSGGYTECLLGSYIVGQGYGSDDATCHGEEYISMGWSCPNNENPPEECTIRNYRVCKNYKCGPMAKVDSFSYCYGPVYGSYFSNFDYPNYSDSASSRYEQRLFVGYHRSVFSTISSPTVCENGCDYDYDEITYYTDSGIPFCQDIDNKFSCIGNNWRWSSETTQLVPGTDQGLNKDTTATIVDAPTGEKCEYICKSGYYRSGDILTGECIPYACTGVLADNAEFYLNDNVGLDANTPITLVDLNTSAKCETHCKEGYYRGTGMDENKCFPYVCVETPSILLNDFSYSCDGFDSGFILDKNYSKVLVPSCTGERPCEYTCFDYGDWVKLKVINGITQCWFSYCGNDYCDDDENYDNCPQDCSPPCGLLDSSCTKNSDCCSNNCVNGKCGGEIDCVTDYGFCDLNSDCCSSTCVEGRCLHRSDCVYKGGFCDLNSDCCSDNCVDGKCDSGIKPQYNCTGFIDSNAVVVEGDDVGLTENLEALLIKSELMNSSRKCEYYCRPGFEKGVGVDENKCVLIKGYYDSCDESNLEEGWVIHSGDDRDLTILDNIIPVLSEQNHPNIKCEYYCDESRGWVMRNGRCVPRFATEGICGDANRTYYLNEEFPGWGDLCNAGDALPSSGLILGSREGDFVEWICVGRDVNANCRATRSEMDISDINAILNLKVTKATTRQIDGSIICSKSNVADLVLFDDKGNQISIDPIKVNCGYQSNSFKLTPSIDLNEGVFYSIRASIKRNSPDCSVCSKTVLFTPRKVRDEKIPDNYFPLIIIILLLVTTILMNKKRVKC